MSDRIQHVIGKLQKFIYLIFALLSFINIRKWGIISETFARTRFDAPFSVSYSQAGEDLALLNVFGSTSGFYIDVGAHDPNRASVTRLLYMKGWRGINVDANADCEPPFMKFRPRDQFIHAAVGTQEKFVFYRFHEHSLNTVNESWKARFVSEGNRLRDIISVPGMTLREIFNKVPDDIEITLLNVDIEGADLEALESLEMKSLPERLKPQWIMVESTPPLSNSMKLPSVSFAIENGYEPYVVLPTVTLLRRKIPNSR